MLNHQPLATALHEERTREIEAWSLGRLAIRIRDCCRPGRLARLVALVRPQRCCAQGAA